MRNYFSWQSLLQLKQVSVGLILIMVMSFVGEALAVNYDVVYVRAPRSGNFIFKKIQEVFNPIDFEPGTDLMLLHPNGSEEVLVPGGNGAVFDPYVSFDGKWVYYAKVHNQVNLNTQRKNGAISGSDIFKINLQTRQVIQLTFQEFTPNTGLANWSSNPASGNSNQAYLGYGVYNTAPCPLPGGRIMFTSSRNGYMGNTVKMFPNLQLFVMDEDGKNVTQVGYHNLGGAMHPVVLKDGRVMFSSYESQGLRFIRNWGLMAMNPDGREATPLMSAFASDFEGGNNNSSLHWQTQLSDGSIVVTEYYSEFNSGFGAFLKFPVDIPPGEPRFGSPNFQDNPFLDFGWYSNGFTSKNRYPFMPYGMESLSQFTWPYDFASPFVNGNFFQGYAGKVTQPSGTSNNELLMVWTPGPANELERDAFIPVFDAGIYVMSGGAPVTNPNNLVLLKNSPNYNEQQPKAVLTYQQIYGVSEPVEIPWLPNDGMLSVELPPGTPYGLVGTSSFYKRDTKPANGNPDFDGLDAFNTYSDFFSRNWKLQGAEAGKYNSNDIFAVRILAIEPTSHISYGPNHVDGFTRNFRVIGNERIRILGEIPLRKFDQQGNIIMDAEGNPDTSFLAKIPADVPFTFQTIDRNGMVLNMSQTWHQVRPGEMRTDCGGCHAHSQLPLDFSQTAAAQPGYEVMDLANTTPLVFSDGQGNSAVFPVNISALDVEYYRDIKPILERSCVPCHSASGNPAANLILDDEFIFNGVDNTYNRLANDSGGFFGIPPLTAPFGWNHNNQSRYIRSFQSRRSLLAWKVFGQRLDGWTNADHPSASVLGNPNTLPGGGSPQEIEKSDIDFTGTIMPPPNSGVPPLSQNEKMLIARWIDIGTPITQPEPYFAQSAFFADEIKPTVFLSSPRAGNNPPGWFQIRVGMHDYYSDIDMNASEVSLNFPITQWNLPAGTNLLQYFVQAADGIYDFYLPTPLNNLPNGVITVRIKDGFGNLTEIKRSFTVGGG